MSIDSIGLNKSNSNFESNDFSTHHDLKGPRLNSILNSLRNCNSKIEKSRRNVNRLSSDRYTIFNSQKNLRFDPIASNGIENSSNLPLVEDNVPAVEEILHGPEKSNPSNLTESIGKLLEIAPMDTVQKKRPFKVRIKRINGKAFWHALKRPRFVAKGAVLEIKRRCRPLTASERTRMLFVLKGLKNVAHAVRPKSLKVVAKTLNFGDPQKILRKEDAKRILELLPSFRMLVDSYKDFFIAKNPALSSFKEELDFAYVELGYPQVPGCPLKIDDVHRYFNVSITDGICFGTSLTHTRFLLELGKKIKTKDPSLLAKACEEAFAGGLSMSSCATQAFYEYLSDHLPLMFDKGNGIATLKWALEEKLNLKDIKSFKTKTSAEATPSFGANELHYFYKVFEGFHLKKIVNETENLLLESLKSKEMREKRVKAFINHLQIHTAEKNKKKPIAAVATKLLDFYSEFLESKDSFEKAKEMLNAIKKEFKDIKIGRDAEKLIARTENLLAHSIKSKKLLENSVQGLLSRLQYHPGEKYQTTPTDNVVRKLSDLYNDLLKSKVSLEEGKEILNCSKKEIEDNKIGIEGEVLIIALCAEEGVMLPIYESLPGPEYFAMMTFKNRIFDQKNKIFADQTEEARRFYKILNSTRQRIIDQVLMDLNGITFDDSLLNFIPGHPANYHDMIEQLEDFNCFGKEFIARPIALEIGFLTGNGGHSISIHKPVGSLIWYTLDPNNGLIEMGKDKQSVINQLHEILKRYPQPRNTDLSQSQIKYGAYELVFTPYKLKKNSSFPLQRTFQHILNRIG